MITMDVKVVYLHVGILQTQQQTIYMSKHQPDLGAQEQKHQWFINIT